MQNKYAILLPCVCLLMDGCSSMPIVSTSEPAHKPKAEPIVSEQHMPTPEPTRELKDSGWPVIGHLKSRGETITIMSGPTGTLYTVRDKNGKALLWEVPVETLRSERPDWNERVNRGMATEASIDY